MPVDGTEQAITTTAGLKERIGAAMSNYDSVQVDVTTNGTESAVGFYTYGDPDDYETDYRASGSPLQAVRKVGDRLYYQLAGSDTWMVYDDEDADDAPAELKPVLVEAADYTLLADLSRELDGAEDVAPAPDGPTDVDGAAVTSYAFTIEPQDLAATSEGAALLPSGDVDVVMSLDDAGLPARLSLTFGDGTELVETFSAWGDPVVVEQPPVG